MRYLLTGVAVVAALAFAPPVGAQPANPAGGNAVGMPGPNPGGPGLTPYTTGPKPSGNNYIPPSTPPAAMAPSETTSATPPHHRHGRHMAQGKPSHHPSRFPNLQGNVANELNQAELSRLQSGAPPGAPPPPEMSQEAPGGSMQANPSQLNRMSTGGRATSGGPR
jgi:hypothetical protein